MLIRPSYLTLCEDLAFGRRRWRIGNLGDEIGSRSFGNSVNEDAQEGDFEEDVEADAEAEEEAFAVMKPQTFLVLGESDSGEVGFELVGESDIVQIRGMAGGV